MSIRRPNDAIHDCGESQQGFRCGQIPRGKGEMFEAMTGVALVQNAYSVVDVAS